MKNNKLAVGTAVIYLGGNIYLTDRIGKVVNAEASDTDVLVDWGKGFNGHYGNNAWGLGECKPGTMWWVNPRELKPVILPEFASDNPKRSTKRKVKVDSTGKRALTPQSEKVLALLKAKGSLTPLEAAGVYRVRSLSRRIVDLKEAGYTIVRSLSKDVTGQRYARYYLKGEPTTQVAA